MRNKHCFPPPPPSSEARVLMGDKENQSEKVCKMMCYLHKLKMLKIKEEHEAIFKLYTRVSLGEAASP